MRCLVCNPTTFAYNVLEHVSMYVITASAHEHHTRNVAWKWWLHNYISQDVTRTSWPFANCNKQHLQLHADNCKPLPFVTCFNVCIWTCFTNLMRGAVRIPISDCVMVAWVELHILLACPIGVVEASCNIVGIRRAWAGQICNHHVVGNLCREEPPPTIQVKFASVSKWCSTFKVEQPSHAKCNLLINNYLVTWHKKSCIVSV